MTMPGFQAEASLYTGGQWRAASRYNYADPGASLVQPAIPRCLLNCDQICEGDIIGACMPWCVCRCRGGRNCGLPS